MKSHSSQSIYKLFFDNTFDGLAYCQTIFDINKKPIDFVYIKVNKNFEKLTGLKKVVGKRMTKLIPNINISNPEFISLICSTLSASGNIKRFESYIKQLAQWFLISVYNLKKDYFIITFQNITDRKQIEKDLEDARIASQNVLEDLSVEKSKLEIAKAKEEAILLSIGDGLLVTNENGNIILINKVAEQLLGRKKEEIIEKIITDVVSIEDEKGILIPSKKRPMNMALVDGKTTVTTTAGPTYYYVRKDKSKFPVAMMVTPVILEGKVIGTIEVFRDITREKEIDKAKSEFVSLASHQLRTPLTTISWYTEMILNGDLGEVIPDQKKYLEQIYQGNEKMIVLVNTLLNVSRIEMGTFMTESKPIDIVDLARDVLNEQKPKIEKKRLTLIQNFDIDIPTISTDPNIRIVFQNILANAVEYTPDGGTIEFSIVYRNKMIHITISDTGYGIPKNQQYQIFTKLFRADNVRVKETNGTGLGLYIVKSIVEKSGGKIWFESEENKGSTFHVTFSPKIAT